MKCVRGSYKVFRGFLNLTQTSNEPHINLERISYESRTTLKRISYESQANLKRTSRNILSDDAMLHNINQLLRIIAQYLSIYKI